LIIFALVLSLIHLRIYTIPVNDETATSDFTGFLFTMENETWKDVPNYEGCYQVSNLGRVKSLSRIILRKGKYPFLSKEKILQNYIDPHGYLTISLHKKSKAVTFKVHKVVAMGFLNHIPDGTHKIVVDHINNVKTDNRPENLQLITQRENASKDRKNKTSKYVGVCWLKADKKWGAYIFLDGKQKKLGYFKDEYDAHLAYQKELNLINNRLNELK